MQTTLKPATLTIHQVAALLGIKPSTAYAHCRSGREELAPGIPIIRVGARYFVPTVAVERVLCTDIDPDALTNDAD